MNKLDSLFDAKQFVVAFGAAACDPSTVSKESQPGARLKSVAAETDFGQKPVHDVRFEGREK
jgi:hypothetical protein